MKKWVVVEKFSLCFTKSSTEGDVCLKSNSGLLWNNVHIRHYVAENQTRGMKMK